MNNSANYDTAVLTVRQLCTLMAPASTDSTEIRIAKAIFRWASVAAGAAVIAVVVR